MIVSLHETAVVILSYNAKKWHELFLPLIVSESAGAYDVILVNNATTDDTVQFVNQAYPSVKIVNIDINKGFANGYAKALEQIKAKYYILLSADFEVTKGWFQPLYKAMSSDALLAACQPKIRYYREREKFEYAGAAGGFKDSLSYMFCRGRILDEIENDINQYDDNIEVFWASGGCLVLKADLYHKVGGLDADFYAHQEEIDLCWRFKNAGYKIGYIASSTVYHVGGSVISYGSPQKLFYNFRNSLVLILKNEPLSKLIWLLPLRLVLDGLAGIQLLFKFNFIGCLTIVKAHFSFYKHIGLWVKHRRLARSTVSNTPNLNGLYRGSILWQYFAKNNKKFSDIKISIKPL